MNGMETVLLTVMLMNCSKSLPLPQLPLHETLVGAVGLPVPV
jgi:hypothetical protein